MQKLLISYDSGATRNFRVEAVLSWREWSPHEAEKIRSVAAGRLRRFSTQDRNGAPCDIERGKQ